MTDEQNRRWTISAALKTKGFKYHAPPDTYRGPVQCGHQKIDVELRIADLDFGEKPSVHIVDRRQIDSDILAHLETESGICYSDGQNLRLDPYDPAGSVLRVLAEVETTLNTSMNKNGLSEISREYPSYWKGATVLFPFPLEADVTTGSIVGTQSGRFLFVPEGHSGGVPGGAKPGSISAVVVSIQSSIRPISSDTISPSTYECFKRWWEGNNLHESWSLDEVERAMSDGSVVMVAADNGILGASLDSPPRRPKSWKRVPRRPISAGASLARFEGARADLGFVTSRCLDEATAPLRHQNIVLVGCGTIGAYLARMLCQVGAGLDGELTLVDPDSIKVENLGRHSCDFVDIGENKVVALGNHLRRLHPDVCIKTVDDKVQAAWHATSRADLIVDTTGTENVSEWINLRALELSETGRAPIFVHGWVFGNGAAAQAFIHKPASGGACLRCLRPRLDAPWVSSPLKRPHTATRFLEGDCGGGAYVPFSVAASSIAAAVVLDAVIDAARGKLTPALRTRVINFDDCKSASNGDFQAIRSASCPACAKRHDSHKE